MTTVECCGEFDGDFLCIEGVVYGPCEYPTCSGACTPWRDCPCDCHKDGKAGVQ